MSICSVLKSIPEAVEKQWTSMLIPFYGLPLVKKSRRRIAPVGVVVKAKTTKSKTPRPFRDCFFSFLYDYGLDGIGTSVDYVFDLRTPKGELNAKAKAIDYNGNGKLDLKQLKLFWMNPNSLKNMKEVNISMENMTLTAYLISFSQKKTIDRNSMTSLEAP